RQPRGAARRHLGADAPPGARLPLGERVAVRPRHHQLRPARDLLPAVLAALRAGRMVVDVAHGFEVARPAVRAALDGAVGREDALDGARQVLAQEARADPGVEVIPRQRFAERTAAEVEVRIETAGRERLAPQLRLAPRAHAGAGSDRTRRGGGRRPAAPARGHGPGAGHRARTPPRATRAGCRASETRFRDGRARGAVAPAGPRSPRRRAAPPTGTGCAASERRSTRSPSPAASRAPRASPGRRAPRCRARPPRSRWATRSC